MSTSQPASGETATATAQQPEADAPTKRSELEDLDAWDPMGEDYRSGLNSLALNPDRNPLSNMVGKMLPIEPKVGGTLLCEHFSKFGTCVDGQYCARRHVEPELREVIFNIQNCYELDRVTKTCLNYTYLSPQMFKPDPEKLLLVSVTNAKSPNNFYLIPPYETLDFSKLTEEEIKFYIENVTKNSAVKTKLLKIHQHLSGLFEKPYRIDNVNDNLYLSQIVACKLNDGIFRRAQVIELADDSIDKFYYKLLLLDIGNEIELPREKIYDIRAVCLSEPPMALNCRLNIKPSNNQLNWSDDILDLFLRRARSHMFLLCKIVNFIQCDRIYTVELLHLTTRKSLTEVLLKTGQVEILD